MKSKTKELLERSISAMTAAIEIYNKPCFSYRIETFSILAINAWELLIKSKWIHEHNNKENSLFVYERRKNKSGTLSKREYIKPTKSGSPHTHSLSYLIKKLVHSNLIDQKISKNIDILTELRDTCVHFYNKDPLLKLRLHEIGAACVQNFTLAVRNWFNCELSEFQIHLMPLSLIDIEANSTGILMNAHERNFIQFLERIDNDTSLSSPYNISINIELNFSRSKARNALLVRPTNDPSFPNLCFKEEDIRQRYPLDYKTLTAKCQSRYSDFKVNPKYHDIRKKIASDARYGTMRYLDPQKQSGSRKPYFSEGILSELDKHYTKKVDS
jgi:hypothetical protein